MYICVCNKITQMDIEREISLSPGIVNVSDLKKKISLGSNCGSCLNYISKNFNSIHSPSDQNNLYYRG